ncbi:unnamed protein product [Lota lota]
MFGVFDEPEKSTAKRRVTSLEAERFLCLPHGCCSSCQTLHFFAKCCPTQVTKVDQAHHKVVTPFYCVRRTVSQPICPLLITGGPFTKAVGDAIALSALAFRPRLHWMGQNGQT